MFWVISQAVQHDKPFIFTDYETAKSWAITTLSQYGVKWGILDTFTGAYFRGDVI